MNELKLYNTLSGEKEIFKPIEEGRVKIYVCGPTVYDFSHIGHARSVVVFDTMVRYFKLSGYDVIYVRNFTDVDDKIINRANETGMTSEEVALKFIDEFKKDMAALYNLDPDHEPKATEHIAEIIEVIEKLMENGYAYRVDDDVYFRVNKFEGYGKLSKRNLEDMQAGARIEIDEKKESPFDFALWKGAKPGEPFWESPFGNGRPGWHIECSAMSSKYLGESFDIHGGGKDLIFPHHENEIAQSEAAHGKSFANYWLHNGFVRIDSEKMSKSLGNFLTIRDTLEKWNPEVVRLFLLSKQYRSPIDFNNDSLKESQTSLDRIYTLIGRYEDECGAVKNTGEDHSKFWQMFIDAMNDDLNTAKVVGIIFEAVRETNKILDTEDGKAEASIIISDIMEIGKCLGILNHTAEEYFKGSVVNSGIDKEEIDRLVQERTDARKNKDFKTSDEIRDKLAAMGVVLEDKPDGTTWKLA